MRYSGVRGGAVILALVVALTATVVGTVLAHLLRKFEERE